jgi:hypothetical protein
VLCIVSCTLHCTLSLYCTLYSTLYPVLSAVPCTLSCTLYHRVDTEWQWPHPGVFSIMMEKLAQPGEGGGCTSTSFPSIYHHVQSCSVRSSWESRYTHPYVLCALYSTMYPIFYSVPYSSLYPVLCTLYSALYTKQCTVQRVCTELNRLSGGKNRRLRSNNFSFLFHFTLKGYTFMRLAGIGACCWESLLFSGRINWAFLWRLILLSRANSSLKSIREKFCSV